ncbi:hypothetical protein COU76_04305 [Candidatus Peregrinibacteria bacterium CG10_big_fil_rev_8_21_14_0_10_49_10]|nr:MAG: hypothetical protein COU76_04305 [Candidatus Peregrinibacteria bacterium CG10_big_fil_rev_8_21_14_0_10_49_10]
MRRLVLTCTVLLAFAGCSSAKHQVSSPPPEEVLRKAADASIALQSARYELSGDVVYQNVDASRTTGKITLNGVLLNAGEQLSFHAILGIRTGHEQGDEILSADVELIVGALQDVFLRLNSFVSEGPSPLFSAERAHQFTGTWWRIPSKKEQSTSLSMTPDPRLLNAQAQVVRVVRDRGLTTIHDRQVYRYDILLDREKLFAYLKAGAEQKGEVLDEDAVSTSLGDLKGEGEIWIDAETYVVQRLLWHLSAASLARVHDVTASFSVDFFDHDRVEPIELPTDAKEFTPFLFLNAPRAAEESDSMLPVSEDMSDTIVPEQ